MDSVCHFRGIRVIFLPALFFFISIGAHGQLWSEDFLGEANGAVTGTAGGTLGGSWSSSYSGSGTFSRQDVTAVNEVFHSSGTTSEGIWSTNTINISSVGYAIINLDVYSAFVGSDDYIRIAYVLDGVEVTFYELIGGNGFAGLSIEAPASAIVAGNSLQLKVYSRNDPGFIPFFNGQYAFDNVTITAAPIIYSRTSGSWTNAVAGTGTWSLTGHTGASCACYPLNTQVAIIGAGHTVTLQTSQTATGTPPTSNLAPGAVDIYGTLQYSTNNNVTLGIQQGLFRVRNGGVVNSNPGTLTGETISFQANVGGAMLQVDAGGTATIEDLALGAAAANLHYLTGGGTLSISDDILIDASGATLTNNRSASLTVSGDIDFNGATSTFVNNAAMTVSGDILMDASNTTFTNNASLTVSDDVDFNAINSTFVNNAAMTIGDDITMDADNSSFTNNATSFTITDDLNFNSINSEFTNNATASVSDIVSTDNADDDNVVTNSAGATLTLGGVNANNADLDVLNSGTITQSGNFSNISNTDTNFDNLATGTWNWTLTPNTTYDTDMNTVLNCAAAGNTFNYSGAGNQSIIPSTYYHLLLSNSGTKLTSAALDVNGNLTISNSAVVSSGANAIDVEGNIDIQNTAILGNGTSTGTINIGGNWSAVNAGSFVEGSRAVTFDGAGAQTITNAAGTETFGALTLTGGGTKSSPNIIDINGNLSIAGTAQFSVSNDISVAGNWAVTSTNGNPFVEGTYTVALDGTGAQAISTVLGAGETFNHLSLTGSNTVSTNSVIDINGNLSIGGSARLDANADISLAGNWSVTSSNGDAFDQGTGALLVTFDGSTDQTITHTGGEVFNRVAVAKPGGNVILNNPITISAGTGTDLTLTQGKIISTLTNIITVSDEATSNGGDADSYVDGPIVKLGEDAFIFPTGNGNYWARIGITPSGAGNTTSFTAQYFASSPPNTSSLSGVARVSTIEYWQLTRANAITNNNVVTLYWESGTRSRITDITPTSNLFVARFDGTNWVSAGGSASGSVATGSAASANITAANINTVTRNYTFGTNIALPDNPLPIELLSFSAHLKNNSVELKWSTASETNNDFFTIERATDVEHFEPILTYDGQGTSKELNHYELVDFAPRYGRSYYRLKQTDFDGKFTYSELRTIDYNGPEFATLTAFPNPLTEPTLNIKIEGLKEAGDVVLQILNLHGQKVFEKVIEIKTPGIITEEISKTTFPSSGLYIIKAGETLYLTEKIVIE